MRLGSSQNIANESQGRDMAVYEDHGRLQVREHMKLLFAILYRYDMQVLLGECGLNLDWESQLLGWLAWNVVHERSRSNGIVDLEL